MTSKRIAIVGAGIAGLTCAYELEQAGFDVTVFEKRAWVGGRMSTRTKDGLAFDLGANHLCNLYTEMQKYCKAFGIEWQKMSFSNYGIFKDGKVIPLEKAASPWSNALFLARQILKGKRRVHDFFDLSNAAHLDQEQGDIYGKKMAGSDINNFLIDGFTSIYQFHRANEISSGAFIALLESLRFDGNGWNLYHLPGGMSTLPNAFASRLKKVHLNTPVTSVEAKDGKVFLQIKDKTEMYDAAVLASTAPATQKYYQHPTPAQQELLDQSKYASTISIAFRLAKNVFPAQSVVWTPFIQSPKISGYTNELMKGTDVQKDGDSLLCVWLHQDFAEGLMNKRDEEVYAAVIPELRRVCPALAGNVTITPHDLERWTEAMPKFAHGHLARVKNFLDHHQGEENIYFCGDYMNSLWTEGSLRGGQRTAKLIGEKFQEK